MHRARNKNIFLNKKILSIRKCSVPSFTYVDFDCYVNRTFNIIKTDNICLKYLLTILNSTVIKFWLREKGKMQGEIFQVDMNPLISIPIAVETNQQSFIEKADQMLILNKNLQVISAKFQRTLQRKFPEQLEKVPKKLKIWHKLSFAGFVKELKKKKIKLSLSEEAEWEDYFLAEQQKAEAIANQIKETDNQIDAMVYELYNLTEEEIEIVENS